MTDTISAYRRSMILKWHADGYLVDEIARLIGLPQQAVIDIIDNAARPEEHKPDIGKDVPLW